MSNVLFCNIKYCCDVSQCLTITKTIWIVNNKAPSPSSQWSTCICSLDIWAMAECNYQYYIRLNKVLPQPTYPNKLREGRAKHILCISSFIHIRTVGEQCLPFSRDWNILSLCWCESLMKSACTVHNEIYSLFSWSSNRFLN